MNPNYFEPNPSYNPKYSGFDRPPQYPIDQSPLQEIVPYDDDDDYDYEESTIPLNEIDSQIPSSMGITPESDEVIKSSVENLVPIPSESEDTSENDSESDLPSCDDFSPINVYEEKSVTFSNPLFDLNDDFTSSDDESLSYEDILEDNVKIYSNTLFEFDDEYIFSDVNPLFDEDECFDQGGDIDEIEFLLHRDPSTPKISVDSILEEFTDEQSLEENDDLFDLKSKENEWKKILYDAPIDDLMTEDKVFLTPRDHEKPFSLTYGELSFVVAIIVLTYFIPNHPSLFTYIYGIPVSSLSPSGSEDIIFDLGIPVFSLEPVASYQSGTFMYFLNERPMEIGSSTCFDLNIMMIWDCPEFDDSRRLSGFVHLPSSLILCMLIYGKSRYLDLISLETMLVVLYGIGSLRL
ncbi:hypothetical protein Tco_0556720 [Tanacetum coccineum]